jgi:fumarate reductase subunit C
VTIRLYIWQRATAAILVPLILIHIAVIFYATRRGLAATDILSRTRGSIAWGAFYGALVFTAAIHGSIGVRNVLAEWSPLKDRAAGIVAVVFAAALIALGLRAVAALVLP